MDEETRVELRKLRQRVAQLEQQAGVSIPAQSFYSKRDWTVFETEVLHEKLEELIGEISCKMGRTRNSVVWKVWNEVAKQRLFPQEPR